jgi:hypothetical protein
MSFESLIFSIEFNWEIRARQDGALQCARSFPTIFETDDPVVALVRGNVWSILLETSPLISDKGSVRGQRQ